jgi:CHAT domain-containing protein
MPVSEALASGLSASKPATLDEIRQSLPPDSALIEYFQVRGSFMAAIVTQETFEILSLTAVERIFPILDRLLFQLSKFRLGLRYLSTFAESLLHTTKEHLKELHDALLAPLEKHFKGSHLIIVPHGILHRLPFQALFDGRRYLIDKFSISYAPSATIHSLCSKRPVNKQGPALVMGVPDEVAPLIKEEAAAVSAIIPDSELVLDKQATTDLLLKKGPACRFIHIATHGHYRQDSPMFSGIRLGDSVLNLLDLYRFKLPAELITLSGCATGLSAVGSGDELLGLVRGLIYAGARAALLTLWDVYDASTLEFMTLFYRHLTMGTNKAVALQQAAQEIRERYPHPYYWAPFSLVGNIS